MNSNVTTTPAQNLQWQIVQLEATQHRAVREFIGGDPTAAAHLKTIDNQIVALRAQLVAAGG